MSVVEIVAYVPPPSPEVDVYSVCARIEAWAPTTVAWRQVFLDSFGRVSHSSGVAFSTPVSPNYPDRHKTLAGLAPGERVEINGCTFERVAFGGDA